MVKFLRRTWNRYSKFGKRRKKKQVWRRPTGRHNKMREKRKGSPAVVSIGYKSNKKLMAKKFVKVYNIKELEKIKKDEIAIISHVGKKKKIEIAKKAKELKIEIYNMNPKKFLQLNTKKEQIKGSETKILSKEQQKTGNFQSSVENIKQKEEKK